MRQAAPQEAPRFSTISFATMHNSDRIHESRYMMFPSVYIQVIVS
ncbi:Uncharacterised protein [Klebsiella pneumoniae]|uniref:Uncharacterized protein n=1 Tax=Klebsiella pneumoniae TaxID=573 RepID=A0A377TUN8_KLEPN|nr:Uncharacterised protein [Klebsiella pneumoniae]